MNFDLNKSYTLADLKEILGDNYNIALSSNPTVSIPKPNKNIVYSFEDFDEDTKSLFHNLYLKIKNLNPEKTFNLFAVGDRVIGNWRNQTETNDINSFYNVNLEVTPYEYYVDNVALPSLQDIGIVADAKILYTFPNKTHMVIIPPPSNE
jgi:hypothetical protein